MANYLEKLEHAKKNIKVADHMLTITHNVVNDPKLLLLVLQKVQNSLQNTLAALLFYDFHFGRIPAFREDFASMLDIFKVRIIRRYSMNHSYVNMLNDIYVIIVLLDIDRDHICIQHTKMYPVYIGFPFPYVIPGIGRCRPRDNIGCRL